MKTHSPSASPSHACAYLRSSKDRHDLSLDAQRRALQDYAHEQGLALVAEYADAVESGKDDDRPGFQGLLRALRDSARAWSVLLALDTSRIARRRHLALIFEHEAEKAGVRILYKSVPDTDPITGMLLRSILQAMDEWHSLTSKPRDLAGLRRKLATLESKIAKLVELMADAGEAAPAYRRSIAAMESERAALAADLEQAATESKQAEVIKAWTAADVERLLAGLRNALEADLAEERTLAAREALAGFVERITLDLESRAWEIHYKLYAGIKMASPRGCSPAPVAWRRTGLPLRKAS